MKKILMVVVVSLLVANTAFAAPADAAADSFEARRAGVLLSSAIAGAVVAGPLGMVVAAASGVWLDQQVEKAGQLNEIKADLVAATTRIDLLNQRLVAAGNASQQLTQIALEQLQLEMLFKTGKSQLTSTGKQRLLMLADFMRENPTLAIRLDGYADPRGDNNHNQLLSAERVAAVAEQLLLAGINQNRISTYAHGASLSEAQQGDMDGYALERVVRIQLSQAQPSNAVAQLK